MSRHRNAAAVLPVPRPANTNTTPSTPARNRHFDRTDGGSCHTAGRLVAPEAAACGLPWIGHAGHLSPCSLLGDGRTGPGLVGAWAGPAQINFRVAGWVARSDPLTRVD